MLEILVHDLFLLLTTNSEGWGGSSTEAGRVVVLKLEGYSSSKAGRVIVLKLGG